MSEPRQVTVAGVRLRCQHCGHGGFHEAATSLNRYPLGFLQLGGIFGHQATMYSCAQCGFLHWFFSVPGAEHQARDLPDAG